MSDRAAATGLTVVLCPGGARAGADVRGGAPGTREIALLRPDNMVDKVHAVLLTGGSAFGLDAAGGVMRYLEDSGVGLDVAGVKVPIVPAAVIFDLGLGDPARRPDADMAYAACAAAGEDPLAPGSHGAGTGATVGKALGLDSAMKGGQGCASAVLDSGVTVGVLVVVNAFGDVRVTGGRRILAGARNPLTGRLADTAALMYRGRELGNILGTSTTLAVVATDAGMSKSECSRVAQMAHDGLARVITPCHTMYDGDTVFALSTGARTERCSAVGSVAADLLARAVERAIREAEGLAGVPSFREVEQGRG